MYLRYSACVCMRKRVCMHVPESIGILWILKTVSEYMWRLWWKRERERARVWIFSIFFLNSFFFYFFFSAARFWVVIAFIGGGVSADVFVYSAMLLLLLLLLLLSSIAVTIHKCIEFFFLLDIGCRTCLYFFFPQWKSPSLFQIVGNHFSWFGRLIRLIGMLCIDLNSSICSKCTSFLLMHITGWTARFCSLKFHMTELF